MKYNIQAKVFGFAFGKLIKGYYKENFPSIDINKILKDVKKEYKAMVKRTPALGPKNGLASNLVGACYFFSMAKKIPGMTPQLLDDMVDYGLDSKFMKKAHEGKKKRGVLFSEKTHKLKRKQAQESQTSSYEMDWQYTYEGNSDEVFYTYTKCGVCRLAERENVKEYLGSMCRMDFGKFKLLGGELYRTKTLAKGDDCCNFHIKKIK